MASPYQYELRERVISAVESGMAVVKVKEIFKVSRATIYRWKKIKQDTGDIKVRSGYQKGHSHIIKDQERFRGFLNKNHDKTLQELSEICPEKLSTTTIHRAIKRLGYSYKKNFLSYEKGYWSKRKVSRNNCNNTKKQTCVYR